MIFDRKFPSGFLFVSAALVVFIFTVALGVNAHPPRAQQSPEQVRVAGHLDLNGIQVKQMFLQQRGGKNYLFLRRADKNNFAVVDVTNPDKPVLVDRNTLQEPAGGTVDLPAPGSALAIAFVPDRNATSAAAMAPAAAVSLPTESVRLIDLTDPKHPKTVKVFDKVTSVVSDDGRKLVFLVNNEGLWVVGHHRNRPLPMCTSESELESVPDCQ